MNNPNRYPTQANYELRVRCLEALGATTSDAQACADAEDDQPHRELDVELRTLMDAVQEADESDPPGVLADAAGILARLQRDEIIETRPVTMPLDNLKRIAEGLARNVTFTPIGDKRLEWDDTLAQVSTTPYIIAAKGAKLAADLKLQILTDAAEAGINAACKVIQDALGVKDGDFAGDWFSDSNQMRQFNELLRGYFEAEAGRLL